MLKDKISSSEQSKHSQIIEAEKLNVPPPPKIDVPIEKPAFKKSQLLDDILKGKELRHIEETKPLNVEPQNDLQKAMAARRADIWDDNEEDSFTDEEDWGEGYKSKAGIPRKRMLMSDYLSMF